MSKEEPELDSILAEYFTWKGEAITEINKTENYKRLKAKLIRLIREQVLEVIGEDEELPDYYRDDYGEVYARNELRVEQRAKLERND